MSMTMDRTPISTPRKTHAPWLIMAAKELRENTKWAVLGTLVFALGIIYLGYVSRPEMANFWTNTGTAFQLGAPLLAGLLGLLQIVPEQRRDLLAFVLHRPAPRASLFWGKAAAGLLLYGAVTVVLLLATYLWAATPGHLEGPFNSGLALDDVYAILSGIPFYFGGMLAALRPARWYGSRILPLAAPIPLIMVNFAGWPAEFWQACILAVAAMVASGVAGRMAFVSQGEFIGSGVPPRAGRAGLGIVLYSSCALVMIGVFAVGAFVKSLLGGKREHYAFRQYSVLPMGDIAEATRADTGTFYKVVRDPSGLPKTGSVRFEDGADSTSLIPSGEPALSPRQRQMPQPIAFTNPDRYISIVNPWSPNGGLWYRTPLSRQLVNYSQRTLLPASVIGPNGFALYGSRRRAGQFGLGFRVLGPGPLPTILVVDGENCYAADVSTQTVWKVALPNPGPAIRSITSVSADMDLNLLPGDSAGLHSTRTPAYVIATDAQFTIIDRLGHVLYTIAREFDAASYPTVCVMGRPTGMLYFAYLSPGGQTNVSMWSASGKHVAAFSLPALKGDYVGGDEAWIGLAIPPSVVAAIYGVAAVEKDGSPEAKRQFNAMLSPTSIQQICLACLSGLICAILAWFIARRCGFTNAQRFGWAFSVFWLGIPGVMLLLAMYSWPALVECPNCSRKRSIDRELCEHCGAPFPAPTRNGTEILEDSTSHAASTYPATETLIA